MGSYIVKRLAQGVFTLVLMSVVNFIIINLPAGDFVTDLSARIASGGGGGFSPEQVEVLRRHYGLDRPYWQQYFYWIGSLVRGEFGMSFEYNVSVLRLIGGDILLLTLVVCGAAFLVSWTIGIPVGVYCATHRYSFMDQVVTFFSYLGMSIPTFLMALIAMYVGIVLFGRWVGGLFSPEYATAPWSWARVADLLKRLWLPAFIVGWADSVYVIRLTRGSMLDTIRQPFTLTARAKGIPERWVTWKHVFRVAANPLVSFLGLQFPRLIAGVIITAIVLDLKVIGPIYYKALQTQDMYVAGAVLMFIGILLVLGAIVADLLLAWVDPRIRYE